MGQFLPEVRGVFKLIKKNMAILEVKIKTQKSQRKAKMQQNTVKQK